MADIKIMACCNTAPQGETIYGSSTANFCCPVCGRKSKPFAVRHEKGPNCIAINRKEIEDVIESWNHDVTESEGTRMKVSYKGVTGELLKLERGGALKSFDVMTRDIRYAGHAYDLELWDDEKAAKISFSSVSMKDVKFLGGEVTFG